MLVLGGAGRQGGWDRPSWPYEVNRGSWQALGLRHWFTFDPDLGYYPYDLCRDADGYAGAYPANYTNARYLTHGYAAYDTSGDLSVAINLGVFADTSVPMSMAIRARYAGGANATLAKITNAADDFAVSLYCRSSGTAGRAYTYDSVTSSYAGGGVCPTTRWFWIVGAWNGMSWRKVFVAYEGYFATATDTATRTAGALTRLYINASTVAAISEVRLYDRVLEDREVQALPAQWTELYWTPTPRVYVDVGGAPAVSVPKAMDNVLRSTWA